MVWWPGLVPEFGRAELSANIIPRLVCVVWWPGLVPEFGRAEVSANIIPHLASIEHIVPPG